MVDKTPWRKISTDKYIIAGVITFLIFSLGLTLGLVLEDQRYGLVEEINQEQEIKSLSLQLQYQFLTSTSSYDNCPTLSATLRSTITDLSDSLGEVIAYEEEQQVSAKRKLNVQRRYVLDNLRYWLLARESKGNCDLNIVPILYFYTEDCPSCPTQGTVLTHYKNIFGDKVLVFPINLDLREEEPMVEIVMSQFNITKFPTIVTDNKKFEGVVGEAQMKEIICESLQNAPECS
jgi:thiol-disulfide isomerase/thioredoxin